MIRYFFVKVVSTATETNPTYAGKVRTYIYGKGEELLFCDHKDPWMKKDNLDSFYFINNYGYKYESHAKRAYSYKHPTHNANWNDSVEIVSVDVEIKPKTKPFDGSVLYKIHKNF